MQSWYWLVLLWLVFVALPVVFPDGRLPSRRWRIPVGLSLAGTAATVVLGMLTDTLTGQDVDYRIDNPIGIEGLAPVEQLRAFAPLGVLLVLGVLTGFASVVVRFRRSHGDERQQTKWFLFAAAPLAVAPASDALSPVVGSIVFGWLITAVPIAVGIAVLRYRLDGIDVVINRTLVYVALTAVVVGIYVMVVGYLGAALFAPLRDRLQRGVGRLLYGSRAELHAALSRLGERLDAPWRRTASFRRSSPPCARRCGCPTPRSRCPSRTGRSRRRGTWSPTRCGCR